VLLLLGLAVYAKSWTSCETFTAWFIGAGDSVLGPRRVPHAFVYDGAGPGRILIGFTPAGRIEEFFRELEKRGEYFGNGSPDDKELVHRLYGIVNVGPPLKL
jgi:hypothetical protein